MPKRADAPKEGLTYAGAGVSIDEGDRFVDLIRSNMRRTFGPRVIDNPGGFAGLFRLDYNERLFKRNYRDPVLVACADGVGTKIKLATAMDRLDTIGVDLVAMNVNDLVVQGAEPLFFLDYIAAHAVDPERLAAIVKGVAGAKQLQHDGNVRMMEMTAGVAGMARRPKDSRSAGVGTHTI